MVHHDKPTHGIDCTWQFSFLAPIQDPHFAKALLHQNLLKASLQSRILCKQHWSNCRRVPTLRWGSLENLHNIWAFSMYCRYSSKVVAPTQRNSPLASSGFRRFPASIASFQTRSVAQMTAWLCVCVRLWYLPLSTGTMPTSSALPKGCVHSLWWKGTPPLAPAPTIVWISSGNQVCQD